MFGVRRALRIAIDKYIDHRLCCDVTHLLHARCALEPGESHPHRPPVHACAASATRGREPRTRLTSAVPCGPRSAVCTNTCLEYMPRLTTEWHQERRAASTGVRCHIRCTDRAPSMRGVGACSVQRAQRHRSLWYAQCTRPPQRHARHAGRSFPPLSKDGATRSNQKPSEASRL